MDDKQRLQQFSQRKDRLFQKARVQVPGALSGPAGRTVAPSPAQAMEMSVLCDCEVAVIVMTQRQQLFEFHSHDRMDDLLARYGKACQEPHERRYNSEFLQKYFEDQASGRLAHDEDEHVVLEEPILPGPVPAQAEAMRPHTDEIARMAREIFTDQAFPSGTESAGSLQSLTAAAEQLFETILREFESAQQQVRGDSALQAILTGKIAHSAPTTAVATAAGAEAAAAAGAEQGVADPGEQQTSNPPSAPSDFQGGSTGAGGSMPAPSRPKGLQLAVSIPDGKRDPIMPVQGSAVGVAPSRFGDIQMLRAAMPSARGGLPSAVGISPGVGLSADLLPNLSVMETPNAEKLLAQGLASLPGLSDMNLGLGFDWPSPKLAAAQPSVRGEHPSTRGPMHEPSRLKMDSNHPAGGLADDLLVGAPGLGDDSPMLAEGGELHGSPPEAKRARLDS